MACLAIAFLRQPSYFCSASFEISRNEPVMYFRG